MSDPWLNAILEEKPPSADPWLAAVLEQPRRSRYTAIKPEERGFPRVPFDEFAQPSDSENAFIQGVGNVATAIPTAIGAAQEATKSFAVPTMMSLTQGPNYSTGKHEELGGSGINVSANPFIQAGTQAQQAVQETFPVQQEGFLRSTLPRAAGSLLAFMGGGVVAGPLAAAGLGSATAAADALGDARKSGADDETSLTAAGINAVIGTSEALPIASFLRRADNVTGGSLKAILKRMVVEGATQGTEEALQEVGQQIASNATARALYDDQREILEGVAEGGAAGGLLGLLVGAIGGRIRDYRGAIAQKIVDNPQLADRITAKDVPSRSDFRGLVRADEPLNQGDRTAIAEEVKALREITQNNAVVTQNNAFQPIPVVPASEQGPLTTDDKNGLAAFGKGAAQAIAGNFYAKIEADLKAGKDIAKKGSYAEQMAQAAYSRGYTSSNQIKSALQLGQSIKDSGGDPSQARAALEQMFPLKEKPNEEVVQDQGQTGQEVETPEAAEGKAVLESGPTAQAEPGKPGQPRRPWEMTQQDYVDSFKGKRVEKRADMGGHLKRLPSLKANHKQEIVTALQLGQPVPPEVLADYPDLKPKAEPVAPSTGQPEVGRTPSQIQREQGVGYAEAVRISEAEKAKKQADVELDNDVLRITPPTGLKRRRDIVPDAIKFPDNDIEDALQRAHGIKKPSIFTRIKEVGAKAWHKSTRAQEFLPETGENASRNNFFRILKETPKVAADEASRNVAAIIDPLGPKQLQAFERKILIDNIDAALKRGEPLRFGMDKFGDDAPVKVAEYKKQIDDVIEQVPELKQAVETRKKVVGELVDRLVANNLLPKEARSQSDTYFHQQVHMYHEASRVSRGATTPRPIKQAFQKGRVTGPEALSTDYDYNTSYVEAEATWMANAEAEIRKHEALNRLMAQDDILPTLKQQAKARDVDWRRLVPDGYSVWQPVPGNSFYQAFTLPDKIAAKIIEDSMGEITADDIKTVLAMGGAKQQYVIPTPLANQLDASKNTETGVIDKAIRDSLSAWKVWTLFNPERAIGYMLRQTTGNLDPVLGSAPEIMRLMPQAVKEIYDYYSKPKLSMSDSVREARDLGVIGSSMVAQEIPDLKDLAVFRRFYESSLSPLRIPTALVDKYFELAKRFATINEDAWRYAGYLHYKQAMKSGKIIKYGGSKPEIIKALRQNEGTEVAAAHLARNLQGDYGNLTVLGSWLRSHAVPFFSWTEVNLKRWPRMAANAIKYGADKGKNPISKGVYAALATSQLATFWAAMYAWNHYVWPEEEDDLSAYDRGNPHIILGRNEDGSVRILRNTGALGDFLEWFGLNTAMSLLPQYESGQIDAATIAKEMAKDPLNKAVQGLSPTLKAPAELLTGQSYFPDVTNPRITDRDELAAGYLGLDDELNEIKGRVLGTGERARKGYMQRFIGRSDPKQNAMSEIYGLRDSFLKKKGKASEGVLSRSAIQDMRKAVENDDYEAFLEAKDTYLKSGKTKKNFEASLRHIDPIGQKLGDADEREFTSKYLNELQRKKLKVARDHAGQVKAKLEDWWRKSGGAK